MIGNTNLPSDANSRAARVLGGLAQPGDAGPTAEHLIEVGRPGRHLAIYPAKAGYELQRE
ncbi:MAG: GNAT family N-acetyltransferase, partial [Ensifer adhaerens]